jgi:putative intracellular protease/amidase
MLKIVLGAMIVGGLIAAMPAGEPQKPVVLKGLDVVQLIDGKEVAGSADLFVEHGKFRYLFASEKDRDAFRATPDNYAVQMNGNCLMSTSMAGDPNLFTVYKGKIYLAGSKSCLEMIKGHEEEAILEQQSRKKVAILIFPGVQIIDYTGPYEVLGQAGYEVFTVAEKAEPLTTNMGMIVTPNYSFENCPTPDILLCPGGNVPQQPEGVNANVEFVKKTSAKAGYTMSVCNGAFWLANAGLLDGKQATTFYGMLEDLQTKFPKVKVIDDAKFADNGTIICTAGLSSGIEGALHLVEKLEGAGQAKSIALNMEYNWQPNSGFARGAFADKNLRKVIGRSGFDLPEGTSVKVLDVDGDRNRWSKSWELSGASLEQWALMQRIQKQLAAHWTVVNSDANGAERVTWKFNDEAGKPWRAETTIKPLVRDKSKFVLSVHLERAG